VICIFDLQSSYKPVFWQNLLKEQVKTFIPPHTRDSKLSSKTFLLKEQAGVKECVGNDRIKEYTDNRIVVWSGK
jgi:hypothetical protein